MKIQLVPVLVVYLFVIPQGPFQHGLRHHAMEVLPAERPTPDPGVALLVQARATLPSVVVLSAVVVLTGVVRWVQATTFKAVRCPRVRLGRCFGLGRSRGCSRLAGAGLPSFSSRLSCHRVRSLLQVYVSGAGSGPHCYHQCRYPFPGPCVPEVRLSPAGAAVLLHRLGPYESGTARVPQKPVGLWAWVSSSLRIRLLLCYTKPLCEAIGSTSTSPVQGKWYRFPLTGPNGEKGLGVRSTRSQVTRQGLLKSAPQHHPA